MCTGHVQDDRTALHRAGSPELDELPPTRPVGGPARDSRGEGLLAKLGLLPASRLLSTGVAERGASWALHNRGAVGLRRSFEASRATGGLVTPG
jgi:hypothetical protein